MAKLRMRENIVRFMCGACGGQGLAKSASQLSDAWGCNSGMGSIALVLVPWVAFAYVQGSCCEDE